MRRRPVEVTAIGAPRTCGERRALIH